MRDQFLALEGQKYLFRLSMDNQVTIICQIYSYVHQILQTKNILVFWYVDPTI